jgi:hypothetical protein
MSSTEKDFYSKEYQINYWQQQGFPSEYVEKFA